MSRTTSSSLYTTRFALLIALTVAGIGVDVAPAHAEDAPKVRPRIKGRKHVITLDSSPQQATVFWDVGAAGRPRDFGVVGYTPIKLSLPRGVVKLIVEVRGFKPIERDLDVRRSEKLTFTLERAPQAGSLDLRAGGDGSAAGAEVVVDGVERGTMPNSFELTAGRHQIEVKKKGFVTWNEWVQIAEGERRTRDVQLKSEAGEAGSILVLAESGTVYVDGEKKDDVPAVVNGVIPGDHVVEIRKAGAEPWRQVVRVEAGKQVKINAQVGLANATGGIRVLSNEQEVEVFLDGTLVGRAPVDLPKVPAGQHVIEGKKKGWKTAEEAVKLTPNEQLMVRLKMEKAPDEKPRGMLSVKSVVPNAEVFLDGASLGSAPVDRRDLEPGKHYVVVRKKGYRDFAREVVLEENKPVSVVAELGAVSRVKFLSNPPGAQVFIDGEPLEGVTPTVKDEVPAGEHQIAFRLKGYDEDRKLVAIEGGGDRILNADLVKSRLGPTPEQLSRMKTGSSTWGAKALAPGGFAADVGTGYPYWLYARLTVSAWQTKAFKLDAGVEMRSYFQTWEFNLHTRAELVQVGPLTLGARVQGGGGPGFNGRNTFSFEAGPLATLSFSNIVNFTVHTTYQFYSDQVCPTDSDINKRGITPREVCMNYQTVAAFDGKDPKDNRFSGHRFFLGGALEVSINRYVSAWTKVDFLPGQFDGRVAFKDEINGIHFENDQLVYVQAGGTLKL